MTAVVAKWETRRTQNPLRETSCGFKSHRRHDCEDGGTVNALDLKSGGRNPLGVQVSFLAPLGSFYISMFKYLNFRNGPIAQLAEQRTFNPHVVGSIPTGLTKKSGPSRWIF